MRFLLLFALAAFLARPLAAAEHTKDSLETVKKNLAEKKAVLVDVREPREWDKGVLKGAELLSLSNLQKAQADPAALGKLTKVLPKDRIVYCHCARGVRALIAADILEKLGYDVRPLKPGFDELRQGGFTVEKKQ
jgi:rhodanese-related sulfurtransferase